MAIQTKNRRRFCENLSRKSVEIQYLFSHNFAQIQVLRENLSARKFLRIRQLLIIFFQNQSEILFMKPHKTALCFFYLCHTYANDHTRVQLSAILVEVDPSHLTSIDNILDLKWLKMKCRIFIFCSILEPVPEEENYQENTCTGACVILQ